MLDDLINKQGSVRDSRAYGETYKQTTYDLKDATAKRDSTLN
jgi:hypothetical protein